MQQVDAPPNGRKIAFFYGFSIGLVLAVVSGVALLSNTFIFDDASTLVPNIILSVLNFLLGLAAYFVAGILASKQTAKVGTGSIAGLWTGVFYGIISFGYSTALFFGVNLPKLMDIYASNATTSSLTQGNYRLGIIGLGISVEIFGLLFAIGLGAGIGTLGGLIGKHTSELVPKTVYPYPAYPYPYPAQPYPAQQVPQAGPDPDGADSTDPNQSYSEHPY